MVASAVDRPNDGRRASVDRVWSKDDADITSEMQRHIAAIQLRKSAFGAESPEAKKVSTLHNADLEKVVSAVSTVIHLYARQAAQSEASATCPSTPPPTKLQIFDEAHHPLDESAIWVTVPSIAAVTAFVTDVQVSLRLDGTCIVMALVLLERAVFASDFIISARTWRVVFLVALVVAAKVVFDEDVYLGDFRDHLPWLDVDLSRQEATFLEMIDYGTVVTSKQFAEYYYALLDVHSPPRNSPPADGRRTLEFDC